MTQSIEILKNVKRGSSTFSFSVKQENNRYKGTWFTVYVKQVTDMSDLHEDDFVCVHKIVCLNSPTEHAAINHAGRKLIREWKNLN